MDISLVLPGEKAPYTGSIVNRDGKMAAIACFLVLLQGLLDHIPPAAEPHSPGIDVFPQSMSSVDLKAR